jgi:pimeloyl-ACP methyl ester carboxylesterase
MNWLVFIDSLLPQKSIEVRSLLQKGSRKGAFVNTHKSVVVNGSATLVVLLHAYTNCASHLASIEHVIRCEWPKADVYRPDLPASLFSMANPNRIVAELLVDIDELFADAQRKNIPYEHIVLVGHSLGALLARKLYVVACGELSKAPLEPEFKQIYSKTVATRIWAAKVSRIILLAGMNRGWRVSHHLNLKHALLWAMGSAICHLTHLFIRRWPLIFTIRRGAEFITQLRIQWLLMRRYVGTAQQPNTCGPGRLGNALTVQLLGSRDDVVAPEDNVDLVSGGDFIYLDVPYSGHIDVVEMDDPVFGPARTKVFLLALRGSAKEMQLEAVVPSDERFAIPNNDVKRMVFVIHGIRDVGYWTHKIARRIKYRAKNPLNEWATETSSYGYFPMLPFLLPWYRRQKVEWLMDQYTEALARYPNASFSYVGHSNGTYLLAKALELYPCCIFDTVVFAGSVVNRFYNWQRFLYTDPPRVKAVLNFVATGDWVVAFFPKLFQLFRLQDIGSAGHDGFAIKQTTPQVYQVTYVKGGHDAAVQEPLWDVIADFVITGKVKVSQIQGTLKKRVFWIELFGRFPPFVWAIIAGIGWVIWEGIAWLICAAIPDALTRSFATGFAMASYFLLLWLVLTRV